ncbi:hypothetical protein RHAL1_03471 [Beijerinckiaceae bacterium RH AL1]|nr:DUF4142 domain-containing protein [Beijerinckiaceae bacterium]VVB48736.1 hypothetical protein RHCH11_RHCH11_03406 [Beijerinckiaceae bacterium RH CH11]VVB48818.1 hypothetical protein RHAL8_03402 [Beijerinckiaceae bacterium RH AL8]VVC56543.1 hypothetical protein RHAL1_03471 [Beijerinckiaceae bacterium RH AL1]
MNKMSKISAITAALLTAAAMPAVAQTAMKMAPGSAMAVTTPEFVKMAAQSDELEIKEGKLAEKVGSPALRKFGMMMVRDHTKTTEGLHAALKKAGMAVPPPPAMTAEQQAMAAKLEGLSGKAFDRAYLEQAVASHKKALALHEAYDTSGDSAPIVSAAKEATPIVREHLQMAKRLAAGKPGAM